MNITELRYLVAIMKWGSVSAAAKQLYAAQPNVSKALKNLEEEYGLRIFERSSTGMIPTEQGKRFIAQAQRVLQQVDELKQEAHQQRSCAELRVVLTHATYASYAAVDFLQQAARSEQLRVHIRESGAIEALDFVLRQGYHMALLRYAAEDEDYYLRYCLCGRAYHAVFLGAAAHQSGQPAASVRRRTAVDFLQRQAAASSGCISRRAALLKPWTLCLPIALLRLPRTRTTTCATASATVCGRSLSWSFPICCSPVRTARWRSVRCEAGRAERLHRGASRRHPSARGGEHGFPLGGEPQPPHPCV